MLHAEFRTPLRGMDLHVTLDVEPGRCVALAGLSGAGKTSTLRAIAGLLDVHEGTVSCDGEIWLDTATGRDLAPERRRCGMVFQDYALFPGMSALRNVEYGIRGARGSQRSRRAADLLERLGIGELADVRPPEMSGGQRQRVALARALAMEPAALLLDEPLSALDPATASSAAGLLGAVLRDCDIPALLVTHDFAHAGLLADQVAVIDGGRIVQRGDAADLAARPKSEFVAAFTGASVLRGEATPGPGGTSDVRLAGGATLVVAGRHEGPVSVILRPWDVAIQSAPAPGPGSSPRNHLPALVTGMSDLGGRVRVALTLPEMLAAEVTSQAAAGLGLHPGVQVTATWKATACTVVPANAAQYTRSSR